MTATLERLAAPTPTRRILNLPRPALRAALAKVMAVTASGGGLAVLRHVLVEARDGVLTLSATNLDTSVRVTIPCDGEGTATALLPAKLFSDILASLPAAGVITLTMHALGAELTAGRSRFELTGLDPEEFPRVKPAPPGRTATVNAGPFLDALSKCAAHASDKESRPILNAVLVEAEAGQVVTVGTDGHSFARLPAGTEGAFPIPCLIHRRAVPVLARLFAGLADGATLTLSADQNILSVETPDASVQVRLVEGPYPNYRQILTLSPTHAVVCDRALFAATLKRVGVASDEHGRVSIDIDEEMVIRTATADVGTAQDVVPIEECSLGAGRSISFDVNAELLATALASLTCDRVRFSIETPEKALLLHPAGQPDSNPTVCLVMPLRRL